MQDIIIQNISLCRRSLYAGYLFIKDISLWKNIVHGIKTCGLAGKGTCCLDCPLAEHGAAKALWEKVITTSSPAKITSWSQNDGPAAHRGDTGSPFSCASRLVLRS